MVETFLSALDQFLAPNVILLMLTAIPIGLLFGILPGLQGLTALAILIPFVYGMEPLEGLTFLLAAHAVNYTGGSITAILLGIPGTAPNAATVLDGYKMSQNGEAGYAIGAALTASGLGGLVGVVILLAILPFLQPIVEAFASPETFFLALLGIAFVGVIGESSRPLRGLISGALGIFISCIGESRITGEARWWFGFDYLLDGFSLAVPALGLFAVPEVYTMISTGRSVSHGAKQATVEFSQVWRGIKAVFIRRWMFLYTSIIGVIIGIIPGVGGETSPFVSYVAARQMSKTPEKFGTGFIDGVIAPEASNNAKEGGALVPTLAFGIPGSAGMAVLIGGFIVLGVDPGPDFLETHLDLAFGLTMVLAVSNVIAALIMLALATKVSLITQLDGRTLGPVLMVLVVLGAFSVNNKPLDVAFVFVFGLLGYCLREYGFSRAALLLGFVLGPLLENNLHISLRSYGLDFVTRPISLTIIALLVAGMLWPVYQSRRREKGGG